jgi:hypothetical protein
MWSARGAGSRPAGRTIHDTRPTAAVVKNVSRMRFPTAPRRDRNLALFMAKRSAGLKENQAGASAFHGNRAAKTGHIAGLNQCSVKEKFSTQGVILEFPTT